MSVLVKMKAVHVTVLILVWGYIGMVPLKAGRYIGMVPLKAGQVCLQVLFRFIIVISKKIFP